MSDRDCEVKYLRFEVDKLRSQVDILKFKIDDLKSGHRSRSRYLWHKTTQLKRAIRFQLRIRNCAAKSIDEIFTDQMMLFKEVDLLLAEVNGLVQQALDLSKTTICYERTPTFRNVVAELNRLRITTTVEPRSLFRRSFDLADKINLLLRTQVMALESLVANPNPHTELMLVVGYLDTSDNVEGRVPHMEEYVKPSFLPQMLLWSNDVEKKF